MTVAGRVADVEAGILARYRERTAASRARHEEARRYLPAGDTRAATFFAPYPHLHDGRRRRLAQRRRRPPLPRSAEQFHLAGPWPRAARISWKRPPTN